MDENRPRKRVMHGELLVQLVDSCARTETEITSVKDLLSDHTDQDADNFHQLRGQLELLAGDVRSLKSNREVAEEAGRASGKISGSTRGTIFGAIAAGLVYGLGKLLGF
jgi:hypothetical protein